MRNRHLVECFDIDDREVKMEFTDRREKEWRIELYASEIHPDNPGEGTPLMVYGPESTSGTYRCVQQTGEIDGWLPLPKEVQDWIDANEDVLMDWENHHFELIEKAEAKS